MFDDTEYLLAGHEKLSRDFNSLGSYYSDVYKDEYGFRPTGMSLCACDYPDGRQLSNAYCHLLRLAEGLDRKRGW